MRSARLDPREIEHNIAAAGDRAGFRPETFAPFLERLPRVIDPEQRITYDGLLEHGLGPIVGRFVTRVNGEYRGVTYIYPPKAVDLPTLGAAVRRVDTRLRLTGVPVVNEELSRRFASEFTKGIVAGTAAVVLLIYIVMGSWKLTALALLPTAAGFVWSAGLLALGHVALDLFSMFAALTFVGIAVDYGIYVLYRYAVEARSVGDVLSRTGAAVGVACLTALVGFGTLVFSSYPPLRLFGIVSVVTLTCCLAAALLFLPALLVYGSSWSRPAR
jgi:predicted exporter